MHPIVDTVCVYCDPERSSTIALIIPLEEKLLEFKNQLCLEDATTKEELCVNQTMVDMILKSMTMLVKNKLEKFEIPQQIQVIFIGLRSVLFYLRSTILYVPINMIISAEIFGKFIFIYS